MSIKTTLISHLFVYLLPSLLNRADQAGNAEKYWNQVRVLSYLLPAMLFSVALNIPKFLEARLDTHEWIDERWKIIWRQFKSKKYKVNKRKTPLWKIIWVKIKVKKHCVDPKKPNKSTVLIMTRAILRNVTREVVIYNVTSLRVDPDYMYYYIHWTR